MLSQSKPIWIFLCIGLGLTLVVLLLTWGAVYLRTTRNLEWGTISLPDGTTFQVEIADTRAEQERGLMGRRTLDSQSGMLFVFSVPGRYTFWMKDTYLDLDFIWVRDGQIVDLTEQVPAGAGLPEAQIAQVTPASPVDWVIEVPAGFVKNHQLQLGQSLTLD